MSVQEMIERFAASTLTAETFVSAELTITWDDGHGPVQAHAVLQSSDDFEACARLLKSLGR